MPSSAVVSNNTPNGPLVDKDGKATFTLLKWMQSVGALVNKGFDQDGTYQGKIGSNASIFGKTSPLAQVIQFINNGGVVQAAGLISATDAEQGAVILPIGASGHTLGSAAMQQVSAFDASGSAAAAQTAAEAHADTVAHTAQTNAEAFATSAITAAFAPGISVTITTAALTVSGTQGSQTFTNGILTAQVAAT